MGLVERSSVSAKSARPFFGFCLAGSVAGGFESRTRARGIRPARMAIAIKLLTEGPQYTRAAAPARKYPATHPARISTTFVLTIFKLGNPCVLRQSSRALLSQDGSTGQECLQL